MVIKFTKHALKQIRLRKITKNEVFSTLNTPDKLSQDKFGNFIAQKRFKNYLLRVFYLHEEDTKLVITAYKTSKLDKYQ